MELEHSVFKLTKNLRKLNLEHWNQKSVSQNISSNSHLKKNKHFQNSKLLLISKLYLFFPFKKIKTAMGGFLYHIFEMLTLHPTLRGKKNSALITQNKFLPSSRKTTLFNWTKETHKTRGKTQAFLTEKVRTWWTDYTNTKKPQTTKKSTKTNIQTEEFSF